MRLFTRKSIIALATFGFLGVMAALVLLGDPGIINAQSTPPFIAEGKVIINGSPAPDGSLIIAYIDGRDVAEAHVRGGTFVMAIPEQPGQSLKGRVVEFAGKGADGTLFDFAQKASWQPGGKAEIRLELNTDAGFTGSRPTTFTSPYVVEGKVIINGNIPSDRTVIAAYIFGSRIPEDTHLRSGRFELKIQQHDGPSLGDQIIEFQALFPDGRFRDFPQTLRWQSGGFGTVALEIGGFRETVKPSEPTSPFGLPSIPGISIPKLPDGLDVGCVMGVLGRIPSGPEDMTPQENFRVTQECFSGGGRDDNTRFEQDNAAQAELENLRIEQEKERLEQDLILQKEEQRLDEDRLKQERTFQEEQQKLDVAQRERELERIKRDQALEDDQDALNRDRLKSERERQVEQDRLDGERLKQDQERLKADQELQIEQQRLDQRRAKQEQDRQDELEKARFESEKARIDRDRALEEERARLDQDRLRREDERLRQDSAFNPGRDGQGPGGQSPNSGDPNQRPGGENVNTGPTRGFFTNSQIGQLGSVNNFMDPATLAVIGILITLSASTMQLVKGN